MALDPAGIGQNAVPAPRPPPRLPGQYSLLLDVVIFEELTPMKSCLPMSLVRVFVIVTLLLPPPAAAHQGTTIAFFR